ncbi:DUF11 domain-containing protein [Leucobacter viscericola]|uniref:DUF11 domain-containing protein n=1 Tax=Leucobacter viscericola TaxID=2714935 RepID=A0A6G7XD94_9MICO|nr:LPXTG cell wall anchor domain-containing protein [Leucobacter viscericola]QIK62523.1 DUF11 domain-containing protein [Leucobacter viscericola]
MTRSISTNGGGGGSQRTLKPGRNRLLAGLAITAMLGASLVGASSSTPAHAAGGSLLLDETFTGASVNDARAIGLSEACLTGASAAPGPTQSNLGPCTETVGTPTPGVLPGFLQLTDNTQYGTGGMVFDRALPSSAGMILNFDQAQYGGAAADGIGFFLSDGSRVLDRVGAEGGSLGYGQNNTTPGVAGGYVGVGLDSWGNFIGDFGGLGRGCATPSPFATRVSNTVSLRGPGEGQTGYCLLAHSAIGPSNNSLLPGNLHSATGPDNAIRNVRITVSPGTFPTVTVDIDFSGTSTNYQNVLTYTMTDPAPATYKFGISGSTGSITDVHLIRNLRIETVDLLGQLDITKQVDRTTPQPDTYTLGDTIPYQFVVTNTGAEPLSDVTVADPLISNVVCPVNELGAAGGPTASMVCTGSLVVTAAQANDPSGTLVNTATASALTSTLEPLTDTSSATVDVDPTAASLTLEKSASVNDDNGNGLADVGETIDYSFVLTNTGSVTLTGVGVNDPKAGAVSCPQTTLAPGATVTCTADAAYTVAEQDVIDGGVVNTATGNASVPEGVEPITPPTDTVTTPTAAVAAGLAIAKSGSLNDTNGNGLADAGETIDYSFVLTNTGNVTLTGVGVDDTKAGAVTCPQTTLAPGASVTCTADASYVVTEDDVLARGVFNTATGIATPPPGVAPIEPPTDTIVTPAAVPGPSLALEKIADLDDANGNGLADAGERIAYSFRVVNNGNVTLTDVSVDDPKAGAVTCPQAVLAPGEQMMCTADAPYTVTEQDVIAGGVVNTATGNATPPEGVDPIVPPTDTVTTPTPSAAGGLSIEKAAKLDDKNANGVADLGETISYSFVLKNTGNVTLTGVGVEDPQAGAVTCPQENLSPGETITCTADAAYVVTEHDLIKGKVLNTATGKAVTPEGIDPVVPPIDTVTTPTAAAVAAMTLAKSAALNDKNGNGLADPDETIDYSFVLMNTGNMTLTDVGVDDPKAGRVNCPRTTLLPGETMTCVTATSYRVTAKDIASGGVVNVATGHATAPEGVDAIVPPTDTVTTATAPAASKPGESLAQTGSNPTAVLLSGFVLLLSGAGIVLWRRRKIATSRG